MQRDKEAFRKKMQEQLKNDFPTREGAPAKKKSGGYGKSNYGKSSYGKSC